MDPTANRLIAPLVGRLIERPDLLGRTATVARWLDAWKRPSLPVASHDAPDRYAAAATSLHAAHTCSVDNMFVAVAVLNENMSRSSKTGHHQQGFGDKPCTRSCSASSRRLKACACTPRAEMRDNHVTCNWVHCNRCQQDRRLWGSVGS